MFASPLQHSHRGKGEMAIPGNTLIPSPELQAELEHLATIVFKAKGTTLFRRGDDVSGVFLIRSGRVSLGLDCKTPIYPARILGPGAIAGLPATVSGNPYSLTAKVIEDSELAFIPRDAVLECLHSNPALCFQVMEMLSGEISDIRSAFKQNGSGRAKA
jgi:CRP/FNR family transcriptional regulator, cyclic AMP receptor protein